MKAAFSMIRYARKHWILWICGIFIPAFFSMAGNVYFADRLQKYVMMITEYQASLDEIFRMLIITLCVLLLLSWTDTIGLYLFSVFSVSLENDLRYEFYKSIVCAPLKELQKISHGELLTRYNTDVEQSGQLASGDIFGVAYPLITGTGYLLAVLLADLRIGFIMVLLGAAVILLNFLFLRRIKHMRTEILQAKENFSSNCGDAIRGKMSVRQYCAQSAMSGKIEEAARRLYEKEWGMARLEALKKLSSGAVADSCMYLLTPLACVLAIYGFIGVPTVLFIHQLCRCFIMYTQNFAASFLHYSEHALSFERVNGVLSIQNEMVENDGIRYETIPENLAVSFRNVSVAYGEYQVLKDVSFTVAPGECIGIAGESGSGKSTLVKVLMQMTGYRGEIYLGEVNCRNLSLYSLRRSIAYSPEYSDIFPASVYENIRYGNGNAAEEDIIRAAEQAGIMADKEGLMGRIIGENGDQLSGGQKQKVSFARALLKNAPVYILDEPTAALDAEAETKILEAILQLKREGKCILLISHKASTLRIADRILHVEGGSVTSLPVQDRQ